MSLFDKLRKQKSASAGNTVGTPSAFYAECVEEYHKAAKDLGRAKGGTILIPELLPYGEQAVLALLRNDELRGQFKNPVVYYGVLVTLSIELGVVMAKKWHEDFKGLNSSYIQSVFNDNISVVCNPIMEELGFAGEDAKGDFYNAIFERWLKLHDPYWSLADPRDFTFAATLAAYQLGVSVFLYENGF